MHLVVAAFWDSTEDPYRDGRDDQRTSNSLQEDGVLDLPESWLLDPDFAIQDFADNVAFLILGNPGFVFVAVGAAKRVEGTFAHVHRRFIIIFSKKLPWAEMAMVHAVKNLFKLAMPARVCFRLMKKRTTHMPFQAAISVATPNMKPIAESALQPRPALLRVMRIALMMPPRMPATPRPRAKMTRGLLPLQMVHRMKLG